MSKLTPGPGVLAVVGGTGALGRGLATRWLRAGYRVVIGSRSVEKAIETAAHLRDSVGGSSVEGMDNRQAAAAAAVVAVTVPFDAQRATLLEIKSDVLGKIVIDATVPLKPPKVGTVCLPAEGSAGQIAQALLGSEVTVVTAFHNVAAAKLVRDEAIDCDVLVCGNDAAARDRVIELVRAAGLRGLHAGPLANSAAAEALTSVLITMNRRYGADGAGIRITGLDEGKVAA